jgi:hypothetical protein
MGGLAAGLVENQHGSGIVMPQAFSHSLRRLKEPELLKAHGEVDSILAIRRHHQFLRLDTEVL